MQAPSSSPSRASRVPQSAQQPAVPAGVERVLNIRKLGSGHQYEVKRHGHAETSWEAASRVRKEAPALVQAFEQQQAHPQQQQQRSEGKPQSDTATLDVTIAGATQREGSSNEGPTPAAMLEQMRAMQQIMQEQQQQLQQLRASPQQSPAQSSQQAARSLAGPAPEAAAAAAAAALSAAASAAQSRFARKEPRAQDLREYEGAAGAKLDEWLQELALATDLYELNAREEVKFATSRLRGPALDWWTQTLSATERATVQDAKALAAGLRGRFQPITTARTAREQLDRLQQGSRGINEYIADFQRLSTQIGLSSLGEENALYAFERGLRREIAVELRKQGVTALRDAIALAARVGGLLQPGTGAGPAPAGRPAAANQMDVDDGDAASLDDRIQRAVLNAMQSQDGPFMGLGAPRAQTQRAGRGAFAGRGGRFDGRGGRGGRGGAAGSAQEQRGPRVPGVPPAVVEQRRV
jgi:hypothetical protein